MKTDRRARIVMAGIEREGVGKRTFRLENVFGKVAEPIRPAVRGTNEDLIHRSVHGQAEMSTDEVRAVTKELIRQRKQARLKAEVARPS